MNVSQSASPLSKSTSSASGSPKGNSNSSGSGSSRISSLFTSRRKSSKESASGTLSPLSLDASSPSRRSRPSTVWSQDSWISESSDGRLSPLTLSRPRTPTSPNASEIFSTTAQGSPATPTREKGSRSHLSSLAFGASKMTRSKSSSSSLAASERPARRVSQPLNYQDQQTTPTLTVFKDINRSLPPTPSSELAASPLASPVRAGSPSSLSASASKAPSAEQDPPARPKAAVKRQRAIQELVTAEAAYAQDLVVICQVYKACAQGHSPSDISSAIQQRFTVEPSTSPALEHSAALHPWSPTDVQQVFLNVDQLAELSQMLVGVLDAASGEEYGLQADDHIGSALLDVLPRMQALYQPYVEKHDGALKRLEDLDEQLQEYHALAQSLANGLTQSWNLNALLIKPVQRCLKYPLLLQAILDHTSPDHPDSANLQKALAESLKMASALNEGRRTRELVERITKPQSSSSSSSKFFMMRKASVKHKRGHSKKQASAHASQPSSSSLSHSATKKWSRSAERSKHAIGFDTVLVPQNDHSGYELVQDLVRRFSLLEHSLITFGEQARAWSSRVRQHVGALTWMVLALTETYKPLRGEQYEIGGSLDRLIDFRHALTDIESHTCPKTMVKVEEMLPSLEKLVFAFKNPRKIIDKRALRLLDYQSARRAGSSEPEATVKRDVSEGDYISLTNRLACELPAFLTAINKAFEQVLLHFSVIQAEHFAEVQQAMSSFAEEKIGESDGAAEITAVQEQFFALPSCRTEEQIRRLAAAGLNSPAQSHSSSLTRSLGSNESFVTSRPFSPPPQPIQRAAVRRITPPNRDSVASSQPSFQFSSSSRPSTHASSLATELDGLPVAFVAVTLEDISPPADAQEKDYPFLSLASGEEVQVLLEEEEGPEPIALVKTACGSVGHVRSCLLVALQ